MHRTDITIPVPRRQRNQIRVPLAGQERSGRLKESPLVSEPSERGKPLRASWTLSARLVCSTLLLLPHGRRISAYAEETRPTQLAEHARILEGHGRTRLRPQVRLHPRQEDVGALNPTAGIHAERRGADRPVRHLAGQGADRIAESNRLPSASPWSCETGQVRWRVEPDRKGALT